MPEELEQNQEQNPENQSASEQPDLPEKGKINNPGWPNYSHSTTIPQHKPPLPHAIPSKQHDRQLKSKREITLEEKKQAVVNALSLGFLYDNAAKVAGVVRGTVYVWMKEDPEFKTRCEQAVMSTKMAVAEALVKAALQGNVKAEMFFLERQVPEFANKPVLTEAELSLLEKIVQTMADQLLLPEVDDSTMLTLYGS